MINYENAIELNGICKNYPGFTLEPITLALPKGTIMGLVGENGAGKSTMIKLAMNAVRRDGGTVRILGEDNESASFRDLKEEIGVVLDEAYFPEVLTVKNVGTVMKRTFRNWETQTYERFIKTMELPENKPFKDFSRGMKMKLAIAVALSHQAKLLILDEATSGLDPMIRDDILEMLNDFTRDESHSILISSHIVSDLEKICDYIAFLHQGKLILCEEKDRLLDSYAIAHLSCRDLEALPKEAIAGVRKNPYGVDALVLRERVPASLNMEHTTLENIILFLVKGGENA